MYYNFKPTATNILLAINLLIFVIATLATSSTTTFTRADGVEFLGVFNTVAFEIGFVWTAITSNFLHVDLIHLLFNMFALYQIGNIIEQFYSGRKVLILYTIAGLTGSIFTYLFYGLFLDVTIDSLGASGAVYGLFGLLFAGAFKNNRYGYGGVPIEPQQLYPTLFLGIIISLSPQINLAAHLGGFLMGVLLSRIFDSSIGVASGKIDSQQTKTTFWICILLNVLAYFLLITNLIFEFITI